MSRSMQTAIWSILAASNPLNEKSSPYVEIDAQLEHRERDLTPLKFCLDGPDEEWKQRVVYTAGLDLSDRSNQTIPIFEIALPGSQRV